MGETRRAPTDTRGLPSPIKVFFFFNFCDSRTPMPQLLDIGFSRFAKCNTKSSVVLVYWSCYAVEDVPQNCTFYLLRFCFFRPVSVCLDGSLSECDVLLFFLRD